MYIFTAHIPYMYIFTAHTSFQDLLNFDDPLNLQAAEHYQRDKVRFQHSDSCVQVGAFFKQIKSLFFCLTALWHSVILEFLHSQTKNIYVNVSLQVSFARKVQQFVRLYAS